MKELINIQKELKAPKNQYNSFGKYKYRSCEDILEWVKPLLSQNNCVLTINDDIVLVGDRYYVKSTATIRNMDNQEVSASAFARESLDKKGMDSAQVTGATSSYARKYALNGLFCIDDTKDADTNDNRATAITEDEFTTLREWMTAANVTEAQIMKSFKIDHINEITPIMLKTAIATLKARVEKGGK